MDRNFGKRHLLGETSPSSDSENLSSPAKQPKIISKDVTATVLSSENLLEETSPSSDSENLSSQAKQPKIISKDVTTTVLSPENLLKEASPSSDAEYLSSPAKQPKIISKDVTTTVLPPEKASTSKEYLVSLSKQSNISIERVPTAITVTSLQQKEATSSEGNLVSQAKQPALSITSIPSEIKPIALQLEDNFISEDTNCSLNTVSKSEKNGGGSLPTETSNFKNAIEYKVKTTKQALESPKSTENVLGCFPSKDASTTTAESTSKIQDYAIEYEDNTAKQAFEIRKSTENVLGCFSSKDASTTTAESSSKFQDHAIVKGEVIKTPKTIPEKASAQELFNEFMSKYASVYNTELVFAVDVVYLVRRLNGLENRSISYVTSGEAPESLCDDAMGDALKVLWEDAKNKHGTQIAKNTETAGLDYSRFQKMILNLADRTEQMTYNTARLLKYCVTVAHWAVCAEIKGISQAVEFAPLVICRTFQNLKDAEKMPAAFWERMAQKAESINKGENINKGESINKGENPKFPGCQV